MSEVDVRKAAIRAARAVAGEYRKRANVPVSDDDIYALRIASDQASTADLFEGLANLLSLTPTQPDREQIELAIHQAVMPEMMSLSQAIGSQEHYNELLTRISGSVLALFNGGTKP